MSSEILYPSQLTGPEALKELVKRSLELMPLDPKLTGYDLDSYASAQAQDIELLQLLAQAVQLEILDKEKI